MFKMFQAGDNSILAPMESEFDNGTAPRRPTTTLLTRGGFDLVESRRGGRVVVYWLGGVEREILQK